MNRMSRKILIIVLVIVLVIIGGTVGFALGKKETTTNNTNIEKTQSENISVHKTVSDIESFSETDLKISSIKLDMFYNDVIKHLGSNFTETTNFDQSTGKDITTMEYKDLGMTIDLSGEEENKVVTNVILKNNKNIELTRGLSLNVTSEKILKSFVSDSILFYKDSESIIVGYPGDDPVYNINKRGKLIFDIDDSTDKVKKVTLTYGREK